LRQQPTNETTRLRPEGNGQPPYLYPDYVATRLRAPKKPLIILPKTLSDTTGPAYGYGPIGELDYDLTRQHAGEPLGERIIVTGRVLDGDGRPHRGSLIEVWQANAAGRYTHHLDRHPAPLDPNFSGAGRCLTDNEGRYRFVTVKPGAYPWKNHHNAWRPAHIHFSLFGSSLRSRLITQMYFPGDPLFEQDPVFQSVGDREAQERMIAAFDLETTEPEWALGYKFDIVLEGRDAIPMENRR
jgi:protocatechuate 3,4-dioxygenase beta subunit